MDWPILLCLLLPYCTTEREREIDGIVAQMHHHHSDVNADHHMDHQAILGSKKSADEFDDLSAEESKKRLQVLAHQMDSNKDGFVDEQELTIWVEKSTISLDEEEVDERIAEIDSNGDGYVYLIVKFSLTITHLSYNTLGISLSAAADVNGDGKLSHSELSAFLNPENYEHMYKTLVGVVPNYDQVTLWEKDINKDGAIDIDEFLGEMAENTQSEWHIVEKNSLISVSLRFTSDYDLDKDGVLRGDEIRRWLIPDVKAIAKQESLHLINGADKDKDTKLSIAEIVDAYVLFVGSEATNFGDDLHKVSHTEL
uniref:EF-hand domain-containing protein n=1 Tax=Heterorhabditis bacteriophora TaxID=37862 RepID=A0A1I7XP02_HETBA